MKDIFQNNKIALCGQKKETIKMNCKKCGAQIPDNSSFCLKCGNPIGANAQNPAVPQTPYNAPNTQGATPPPIYSAPPQAPNMYAQPSAPEPKKKKKKGCLVVFLIILALFVLFFFGLLFLSPSDTPDDSKLPAGADTATSQAAQNPSSESVTIEPQVLFDSNSIKVTATSLDVDGFFGADINVTIENNSAKNVTVQANACSVNGVMVETIFSSDVATGKKANDSITLSSVDLKAANITTIKDIEFILHIYDSDSYDTIVDSNTIKITTSADSNYVQTYDDSGFLAYEDSMVKIVVKKLNSSESFWGSDVYLYIENKSDKSITVQATDVSINGFMVDPAFSCEVNTGKRAFDTITFFESDLEKNGITDITEIELKFHIFETESGNDIKDTESIIIKF